mmetsp:Transcript_60431/g.132274  ORF Transcript_60431/g.132274 Transcript_60431/m.132274 type:complete len:263 (+) Transcript_60431:62-850(+)
MHPSVYEAVLESVFHGNLLLQERAAKLQKEVFDLTSRSQSIGDGCRRWGRRRGGLLLAQGAARRGGLAVHGASRRAHAVAVEVVVVVLAGGLEEGLCQRCQHLSHSWLAPSAARSGNHTPHNLFADFRAWLRPLLCKGLQIVLVRGTSEENFSHELEHCLSRRLLRSVAAAPSDGPSHVLKLLLRGSSGGAWTSHRRERAHGDVFVDRLLRLAPRGWQLRSEEGVRNVAQHRGDLVQLRGRQISKVTDTGCHGADLRGGGAL